MKEYIGRILSGIRMLASMHAVPSRRVASVLSLGLFLALIGAYQYGSYIRHLENPQDKVMPTPEVLTRKFVNLTADFVQDLYVSAKNLAFLVVGAEDSIDPRPTSQLAKDLKASGFRFFVSLALLPLFVLLGLHMGTLPYLGSMFYRFVVFFDKLPALLLLPIIFIIFGLGELSKVMLIVIGVAPTIVLDTYLRAKAIPEEQKTKAFTLGASNPEVALRVVLPQIWPGVLNTIRLNFKAMVLFLIAGESLAASEGMGYRVFIVRRYLAMDTILVYTLIMCVIFYLMDHGVSWWIKRRYRWQEDR